MGKTQRIRDPIHHLIVFQGNDDCDQIAWELINTREFQRLRRIRQLGFSELVFPGATHTRFSHSIGVFHTARQLISVIKRKITKFNNYKANVAILAALLHDIGHGPFSHAFESVERKRGEKKRHEEWTAEIITGDTEIHDVLDKHGKDLAKNISELLLQSEPNDIYSSVVSSQFDADRIDYLRRDRYMTGTGAGSIDFDWLLDCLEVGKLHIEHGGEKEPIEVDGLYLGYKGLQAAEEYLLARFHLYSQVYMHKTTRAAEQMLAAILVGLFEHINENGNDILKLSKNHPLIKFYNNNDESKLSNYIDLDDTIIWSVIAELRRSSDTFLKSMSNNLLDRRLYKCFDAGMLADIRRGDSLQRFRKKLKDTVIDKNLVEGKNLLVDTTKITAYGLYEFEDPGALQKILIGEKETDNKEDIGNRSHVVKSNLEQRIYRIYVPNEEVVNKLHTLWMEVANE